MATTFMGLTYNQWYFLRRWADVNEVRIGRPVSRLRVPQVYRKSAYEKDLDFIAALFTDGQYTFSGCVKLRRAYKKAHPEWRG